jgi:hypothetical protein
MGYENVRLSILKFTWLWRISNNFI